MTVNFGVNYLAIVAATVAALLIGIVYYGLAGVGNRLAAIEGRTPTGAPSPAQFVIGAVTGFVNAWALAILALNLGTASIADAILLGVFAWVGFGATFKAAQVVFEGRPWAGWLLTGIHDVIIQVVIAAIVTAWR